MKLKDDQCADFRGEPLYPIPKNDFFNVPIYNKMTLKMENYKNLDQFFANAIP